MRIRIIELEDTYISQYKRNFFCRWKTLNTYLCKGNWELDNIKESTKEKVSNFKVKEFEKIHEVKL